MKFTPARSASIHVLSRAAPNATSLLKTDCTYIATSRVPNYEQLGLADAAENVRIHHLGQAVVSPSGVVFLEGIAIDETYKTRNFTARQCAEMASPPTGQQIRLPQALLVHSPAPGNYYHFLFDYCARARFAIGINFLKRHTRLSSNLLGYQQQILAALDIPTGDMLFSGSYWIYVDSLVFIEQRNFGRYFPVQVIDAMRKFRDKQHDQHGSETGGKIYLSRKSQSSRRIENEVELEKFLVQKGFQIVTPESLSFRQQADLFAGASVVIGASGAAFSNLPFCRVGTKVIELRPDIPKIPHSAYFWTNFARTCGLSHFSISLAEKFIDDTDRAQPALFSVKIDDLCDALSNVDALM